MPVKKQWGKEASKQRLMKAGVEIFSQFGFDGATTRMLSEKSGVNESLIVRYFDGKAGLLTAILVEFIKREKESKDHHPMGKTLEEEIRNFFHASLHHDLENRNFFRIAVSRAAIDAKMRKAVHKEVIDQCGSYLEDRLLVFRKKGQISPKHDLKILSEAILFQMLGTKFMIFMLPEIEMDKTIAALDFFAKQLAASVR